MATDPDDRNANLDTSDLRSNRSNRSARRRFPLFGRPKRSERAWPGVNHDHADESVDFNKLNLQQEEEEEEEQRNQHQSRDEDVVDPVPPPMSARSVSPNVPSIFDDDADADHLRGSSTVPTTAAFGQADEPSYDLKPPPPSVRHSNIEALSTRLFSVDHLDTILRNPHIAARFTRFLNTYRPQSSEILKRYLEAKKATSALEYANAVADSISNRQGHHPLMAATLDDRFAAKMNDEVEELVDDALPAYITHRLVTSVTDALVKEITLQSMPAMRELIPSLAEVYCVTDPSLPDNPIVYASQEFYNVSQYGREYVIGRNCRFLQGPKTSNSTVRRLIEALAAGQEICETVLNYRRDGSPFMNLLMIAPLYDNKGHVRYFLGCQIDVSPLIDAGRGLDSFEQLLAQDRAESRFGGALEKDPKHALTRFGQLLNDDELFAVRTRARSDSEGSPARETTASARPSREPRRFLGMDDTSAERPLWPHPSLGPSGRLPGVYQNYLLVRPYPSLRITFTSPSMRIPGLLQTKFLDRIGGPQSLREGILDALAHGTGVTAKVPWLTNAPPPSANGTGSGYHHSSNNNNSIHSVGGNPDARPRWIHCTPLLGSDERVGVWIVVLVENETVSGSLHRPQPDARLAGPIQLGGGGGGGGGAGSSNGQGVASPRFAGNREKLYAEYLRREGRPGTDGSGHTSSSQRERTEVDAHFRDF